MFGKPFSRGSPGWYAVILLAGLSVSQAWADEPRIEPVEPPPPPPAVELSPRFERIEESEELHIDISLADQILRLVDEQGPLLIARVSTGRRPGLTPVGRFRVTAKELEARSSHYGRYLDAKGRVLRSGVSLQTDPAPSGGSFEALPLSYRLRLGEDGPSIFGGDPPGYPSTYGAVILPMEAARRLFEVVQEGMEVRIRAD